MPIADARPTLTKITQLLKDNQVQAAADLAAATHAELTAAAIAAGEAPPPPPAPRPPAAVVAEILALIAAALGNPGSLLTLLEELAAVTVPPAP